MAVELVLEIETVMEMANGRITLKRGGNSVPNALIKFYYNKKLAVIKKTNQNGVVIIPDIQTKKYEVEVRLKGEKVLLGSVDFTKSYSSPVIPRLVNQEQIGKILFIVKDNIRQQPVSGVEIICNTSGIITTTPDYTDSLGEVEFDLKSSSPISTPITVSFTVDGNTTYTFVFSNMEEYIQQHFVNIA